MESKIYNQSGKEVGTIGLPEAVFGASWNADLIHQVVTSTMSSRRKTVAHAKDRGEVSGGGRKPWKQKGTGRARHGSTRSPIWVGGGVAHGPITEKNFDRKVNKKMKDRALCVVLSKKFKDGEILFVDSLALKEAKTKEAKGVVTALGTISGYEGVATKRSNAVYLTTSTKNVQVERSFKNFGNIEVNELRNINPVDILQYKYIVIVDPKESLSALEKRVDRVKTK